MCIKNHKMYMKHETNGTKNNITLNYSIANKKKKSVEKKIENNIKKIHDFLKSVKFISHKHNITTNTQYTQKQEKNKTLIT